MKIEKIHTDADANLLKIAKMIFGDIVIAAEVVTYFYDSYSEAEIADRKKWVFFTKEEVEEAAKDGLEFGGKMFQLTFINGHVVSFNSSEWADIKLVKKIKKR